MKPRRINQNTISIITQMWRDGYKITEISLKSGTSRPTIYNIVKEFKIERGNYVINKQTDENVINLYTVEKLSKINISKKIDITIKKINQIIVKYNLQRFIGRRWKYLCNSSEDGTIRITTQEWEQCLILQDYKCIICGKSFHDISPMADHKHGSKHIRGFLCRRCNCGLGFVEDKNYLNNALKYLDKYK